MRCPTLQTPRRRPAAPWARSGSRGVTAVSGGLTVVVCLATGWGSVPPHVVVLMAAVVAVAELVEVPARSGASRWPVSLADGAVGACLLLGDGAWSVAAVGAGVVAAQLVRGPSRHRALDLAVRLFSTALAQAVGGVLGGDLVGAVTGLAVFWLVGCALVASAVAAISQRPLLSLVLCIARTSALPAAAGAGVGLLVTGVALQTPLGLLGLAAAAAAVRWASSSAARHRGEARLFAHLAQAPERSPDASAQLLVTAAARLLHGADVELVVLDSVLPRRFSGDERGRPGRPSDVVALDEPWVLEALTSPEVRRSREDDRPTLSTVLSRPGRPRAVLRARRAAGAPDFDRDDLRSI